MRILYVSQYYPPETNAPAARVSELAREWARLGRRVTVLTGFPQHPAGIKRPQDRGVLYRKERDAGTRIERVYLFAARNAGRVRRAISFVSFMVSAIVLGTFRVRRPDVVIATSPQLLTVVAGWWLAKVKRAPLVFEVRDVWPESVIEVGALRAGWITWALKALAARLYRDCHHIVTVGEGYRRRLMRDYAAPSEKIDVVTNGVDLDFFLFDPRQRESERMARGWDGRFVVLYLGTHGMAQGLATVLEASGRLRHRSEILFVFVGDGAEKPMLEKLAADRRLENVLFLPTQPKDAVVGLYAAADVCLAPLRKKELFAEVLPSKLFEIMAMRRPILCSVAGDAWEEVRRAGAGWFVEPENPDQLARAIEALADDPEARHKMGDGGRQHVERFFSRAALARRYLQILDRIIADRSASSPAPAAHDQAA